MSARKLSALASAFLAIAPAAHAQTVDYTAAQQMFGEPVTMSAIGKPQRASEAPANIDIITADDIRRSGATDIPSILRFVPGLDVRRYGQFHTVVGIRGYNTTGNPRVLVLLDGRQVYQDDYGYTIWSQIPVTLSEIRQIEIIKGPNAALYGFNAVSGVINIVTYDSLRDKKNALDLRGGTQAQIYGEGVATFQIPDRLGLRVSAKGTRVDEFAGFETPDSIEHPNVRTGSANMRYRLTDRIEFDLSASLGTIESDFYSDVGTYRPVKVGIDSVRAALTADTSIGLLQFDAYRNATDFDLANRPIDLEWNQDVTVVKANDLVRIGTDHTIRIGAEYRHNSISSDDFFGGEMNSDLFAGSAMWNWQILPELSLTNAARFDGMSIQRGGADTFIPGIGTRFGDRNIIEPSFNSALLYSPTDFDSFRLSAARAVQLPSLLSFGLLYSSFPVIAAGTTALDPSAVMNYEAGYSRKIPDINSQIGFSIFTQNTDRTIGTPFGSPPTFTPFGNVALLARNFAGSSAVGGEIGIDGQSEAGWRWNLAYALTEIDDRTPADILADAPSVSYAVQNPVHSVTAGLGVTWNKLELDGQARWESRFEDYRIDETSLQYETTDVPDYVTLNARAGYKIHDNATLSVTAEQLNAARIVTSAGRRSERRLLAGLKIEF